MEFQSGCCHPTRKRIMSCKANKKHQKTRLTKNWEIVLAILAILDLFSCISDLAGIALPSIYQGGTVDFMIPVSAINSISTKSDLDMFNETEPLSSVANFSHTNDASMHKKGPRKRNGFFQRFRKKSPQETVGVKLADSVKSQVPQSRHTIQDVTNKIFVLALCIHAVFVSWNKSLGYDRNDNTADRQPKTRLKYSIKQKTRIFAVFLATLCLKFAMLPLISTQSNWNNMQAGLNFVHKSSKGHAKVRTFDYIGQAKSLSLGEAFLLVLNEWFHSSALVLMRKRWKKFVMKSVTRVAAFAVMNPFRARKRLMYLRWVRFAFPFVGIFNKLKGNIMDLIKKHKQRRRKKKAKLSWKSLLNSLSREERLEMATLRIQANFRKGQERRAAERLREIKKKEENASIMKAHNLFRAHANLTKARMASSAQSLSPRSKKRVITEEDRASFSLLKEELKKPNITKRKMLLRPNTGFSVVWKTLSVTCIVLEIFQLVFSHYGPGYAKLSLEQGIDKFFLVPNACKATVKTKVAGTLIKNAFPIMKTNSIFLCSTSPLWKNVMLIFMKTSGRVFVLSFKIISFLDVFITFFTGEIAESNGALIPKPFVTRWLVPGIILQLMVNPSMKDALNLTKKILHLCYTAGPCRVFHTSVAIYPFFHILCLKTINYLIPFLNERNQRLGKRFSKRC